MNILFLTPQLPYPPEKGTALRNWGLISGLAARHEVAVLSFVDPPPLSPPVGGMNGSSRPAGGKKEPLPLSPPVGGMDGFSPPAGGMDDFSPPAGGMKGGRAGPLSAVCRVEAVAPPVRTLRDRLRDMLTTRQPDMALRLASRAYARRLADWLARERFDVVHVEGIEMAPYLDVIEAIHPSPSPSPLGRGEGVPSRPLVIFDDHNCEYLLQQRVFLTDLRIPSRWPGAAYSFVQWRRLRRYEAQVCRRADRVLAVSDADAAALHKLVPDLEVTVIPNGIDTQVYTPTPPHPHTPTLPYSHTPTLLPSHPRLHRHDGLPPQRGCGAVVCAGGAAPGAGGGARGAPRHRRAAAPPATGRAAG